MAAWLRRDDLLGVKWVSGYASNFERGLPFVMGLIVLNDPDTGRPVVRHGLHRCYRCANG